MNELPHSKKGPYRGFQRNNRRQAHHEDAHGEPPAAEAALEPILPDSPLICRTPPSLIETQADLTSLLHRLRAVGRFAYDSEFIGESTYTPLLCLVQIATPDEVALVDPLAKGIDLRPFWDLLRDESVEKIVHAGQQDVEPVVRLTGDRPRNVFDTQIAGGFVGMTYPVSLSKLVAEMVGVKLAKGMTFTQWDLRPLSPTQLRYAADDVRYLPAIHEELTQRLTTRGHLAKAREEFDALCEPSQYIFNPDTYIHRVRGSNSLSGPQLRILRELVIWRNEAAKKVNAPARAYLKDEVLVDLAKYAPKDTSRFAKVRGLPRPVEIEYGQTILDAVARGLAAAPVKAAPDDRNDEPTPTAKFRADIVWTAAQAICQNLGIDPMMGASRTEIGKLTWSLWNGREAPKDLHVMKGWRKTLLGDPLTHLIQNGGEISVKV